MRQIVAALIGISAMISAAIAASPPQDSLAWAYPANPPHRTPPPDDDAPQRVSASRITYTLAQIRDHFNTPDWHPEDHPPLPEVVARGRKPYLFACGSCHRAEGHGGPESADLAGLSADYIVQQMADFKSGARRSSVPKRSAEAMILVANAADAEDIRLAATYFSALKPAALIRVIESETAPKTHVVDWHLEADGSGEKETLGQRIIEIPQNAQQFSAHDSRAHFIAYVPPGSVRAGQSLATGGSGKTPPCAMCHGAGLKGLGPIPRLAGRSPTYLFRQLYDFRSGARSGPSSAMMRGVVQNLTVKDMIALSAYAASLPP
jgi:cytochrome c553